MKFTYKARVNDSIQEGEVESSNRSEAVSSLSKSGMKVISIVQKRERGGNISIPFLDKLLGGVKLSEKVLFAKNLQGMIKAGIPLYRGLAVLEKQTKNPTLKKIIVDLMDNVNKGNSLSEALVKHENVFGPLFIAMVRAGEESGNLTNALGEISFNLEKLYKLKKKVKGAMVYPTVIMTAVFIVGILMFIFVVPTMTKMFKEMNTDLPASTKVVIGLADLFENHTFLVLGVLIAIIVGFIFILKSKKAGPVIDKVILHLPVIKTITIELNTSRTARTMASLLSSGVPLVRSLEITGSVIQNTLFKKVLESSAKDIVKGVPFSKTLQTYGSKLYPVMFREMVEVGEETGNMTQMLNDSAVFYEEEVEQKTKDLSTIVEPVLMIFIGGAVGFFAVSMITPMYSVMSNF